MNSTLRFRKARNSADQQGQIFTPFPIASLLAASVPADCKTIVDVGAGTGILASAILQRCPAATTFLLERDPVYAAELATRFIDNAQVVSGDALAPGVLETITKRGPRNVILSNPPYGMEKVATSFVDEPDFGTLRPSVSGGWIRRDAAFLCRIWNASSRGDVVGFIVASPIINGIEHQNLRKTLTQELSDLVVTELHPKTFANAEVQAYLITGHRSMRRARSVVLRQADSNGVVGRELVISNKEALHRLDFTYHSTVHELQLRPDQVLGGLSELGAVINRGSRSRNNYKELGYSAFHTTDFVLNSKHLTLAGAVDGYNSARPGDLLIPRVGSRCLIHEAQVIEGVGLITDCIYRIRAPSGVQQNIWRTLNSEFGREWRRLAAKGSCAKYITISALASMPILA